MHEEDITSNEGTTLLPPEAIKSKSRAGSLIKNEEKSSDAQLLKNSRNNANMSSHNSLVENTGPLSTYAEFKKVFDAKHVGQKSNRRQA
jgi:hypothetical protein